MSVNLVSPDGVHPVNGNQESEGLSILRQHNLDTLELCEKLRQIEALDDRWRPAFSFEGRYRVGEAIKRLGAVDLINEENLTRFFDLDDQVRQRLSGVFSVLEPTGHRVENLLDQRVLTACFEHPQQDWHNSLSRLDGKWILNRDILNTLIDPENVANASNIATGFVMVDDIRVNGCHLENPLLGEYRASLVQAGEYAARLGEGLKAVYKLEAPEYILNACKAAILNDPENAPIIGNGLVKLVEIGRLEAYWQEVIRAREHAFTLANALVSLGPDSRYTRQVLEADPQFANEVARGLIALMSFPNLQRNKQCVIALISGEPKGENARAIVQRLYKIGTQATLEQFNDIIANLPTPGYFIK